MYKKILILVVLVVLLIGSSAQNVNAQAICLVTGVAWNSGSVNAGDTATFTITINNRGLCNGQNVGVNIFEDDLIGDDRINLVYQPFSAPSGNSMQMTYAFTAADFDAASETGEGATEEIYLIASTPGQTVPVQSSTINFNRGASAQRWACVSEGIYACSPGNLSTCSDIVGGCDGGCIQIDASRCGQSAGGPGPGPGGPPASGSNPESPGQDLSIQRLYGIIVGLVCWLSRVALVIMTIAIVAYAAMMMWAGENAAAYGEAKKSLAWAVVGCLVVLGTYTIVATVANFVNEAGSGETTSPVPLNWALPIDCSGGATGE
jgi:hypothetical protein